MNAVNFNLQEFVTKNSNTIHKANSVMILGSILLLMLKFFHYTTLFLFLTLFTSFSILAYLKYTEFKQKGFIFILPKFIQKILLERSIFDILMDIWYLPSLSKYIKMLFKPLIYNLSPTEATEVLKDFDHSTQKLFITKGIINLFPRKINRLMLGTSDKFLDKPEENHSGSTKHEENELFDLKSQNSEEIRIEEEILVPSSDSNSIKASSFLIKKDEEKKESKQSISKIVEPQIEIVEIDDPILGKIRFRNRLIQSSDKMRLKNKKNNMFSIEEVQKVLKKSNIPPHIKIDFDNFEDFNFSELKNFYWDNLDLYYRNEAKKELISLNNSKEPSIAKIPFNDVLKNLIKSHLLSGVNYGKISKIGMASLVSILLQVVINKKMRNFSVSFIKFLMFLVTSIGLGTCVYITFLKENTDQVDEKENKNGKSSEVKKSVNIVNSLISRLRK